jgi:hypothetical protein
MRWPPIYNNLGKAAKGFFFQIIRAIVLLHFFLINPINFEPSVTSEYFYV